MQSPLKEAAKKSLGTGSYTYNILRWVYGCVAQKPGVRRKATRAIRMRASKDSRFDESELNMACACPTKILDAVIREWEPKTFLDIGCGIGKALEYVADKGIECVGIEGSESAIRSSPVSQSIMCADLNKPVRLGKKFDVVWSYEVAEHIHPKFADIYLETLTSHGDRIAMSAARPGQGGAGHFNEQHPQYWIDRIESRGFKYQPEFTEHLHNLHDLWSDNMMVFLRQQ